MKDPARVKMGKSNRRRGRDFEPRVTAWWHAHGWIAGNTRGSHGIEDGYAMKAGHDPVLWQAKLSGYLAPKERLDLIARAETAGAVPLLIDRPARGRIRARRLLINGEGYDEWTTAPHSAAGQSQRGM